jgi:hypothetical protein
LCCAGDRRSGHGAVLMLVDDQAEAETIAVELRREGVHVGVVTVPKKSTPEPSEE